jgi:hypothetical protein
MDQEWARGGWGGYVKTLNIKPYSPEFGRLCRMHGPPPWRPTNYQATVLTAWRGHIFCNTVRSPTSYHTSPKSQSIIAWGGWRWGIPPHSPPRAPRPRSSCSQCRAALPLLHPPPPLSLPQCKAKTWVHKKHYFTSLPCSFPAIFATN